MSNKPLDITAVVVSYNCADVIEDCIKSLIDENISKIVVIDNCSTDVTQEIISKFEGQIKFIKNNINRGFTKACNQGIREANTSFVLFFNPDAYTKQGALKILYNRLIENKKLGAVAPQLLYPDGKIQNYNRRFPILFGVLVESFVPSIFWNKFKSYRYYTYQDINLSENNNIEQPAGAAILFRNEFLLDENYFIYGSDVELCKNIIDKGYSIETEVSAMVFHHQSKGGTGETNHYLKMKLQLEYYFAIRYFYKKHRMILKHFSYVFINSFMLFITAILSFFSLNKSKITIKWERFFYFLMNKKMGDGGIII